MVEENEDAGFDRVMKLVGDNGKFQQAFNYFYNIALIVFASMCYMNSALVLNEPDHTCHVPGRESHNLTIDQWLNLTIPHETDNYGTLSQSGCKMYNTTLVAHLPTDEWKFTENDTIPCVYGYDYDKTWYDRTAVSDEDWICDKTLYQTNIFVLHRVGDIVGTFFFGQLGDAIGRRPIFYVSIVLIIVGRVMSIVTTSNFLLYAIASFISTMTTTMVYVSPLIIAMEVSGEEDHGKVALLQCIGWTAGMSLMPLVFWATRDWVWFLMLTSLPIGLFGLWNKYMLESPRWLATKGQYRKCAKVLNRIAKLNGKDVKITEKTLIDAMPDQESEKVFGIMSLFTHWRLAKNTMMLFICWSNFEITYILLMLNSTRMGGNPFLNFLYHSAIEVLSYACGIYLTDRIGRRYSNALAMILICFTCVPVILLARDRESEYIVRGLVVFIKLLISFLFFTINLQALEIFPTCLRQSGMSASIIAGCTFATVGPYIMYLGTEYDVRYPYFAIGALAFLGLIASLSLPETLHHKLPNTLYDAKKFGRDQKFWFLPKKPIEANEEEMESLRKLPETRDIGQNEV